MKNMIINVVLVVVVIALLVIFAMLVRVGAAPDFPAGENAGCNRGCCGIIDEKR